MKVIFNLDSGNIDFCFDFPSRINKGDLVILENFVDEKFLLSKGYSEIDANKLLKRIEDKVYTCEEIYWVVTNDEITQSVYFKEE